MKYFIHTVNTVHSQKSTFFGFVFSLKTMSQYLGFARKIILVRERGRGFLLYSSVNYLILIPCFFRNIKVISYTFISFGKRLMQIKTTRLFFFRKDPHDVWMSITPRFKTVNCYVVVIVSKSITSFLFTWIFGPLFLRYCLLEFNSIILCKD